MTKSHYPYPPDEFDVRGPEGSPVGVHREPRSGWSSAWPFLLVAVVFAGLAVGIVSLLSNDPGATENPPAAQQESAAPESSAEGEASEGDGSGEESADGSGEASEGDGSGESEEPADGEATEEPAEDSGDGSADIDALVAAGDTSAYVRVLNDGGPGGEAGRGAEALGAQGFTNVVPDNYPTDSSGQASNVVWYVEGRAETAAAVAAVLGIPAEQTSQQQLSDGDVIVVVKSAFDLPE